MAATRLRAARRLAFALAVLAAAHAGAGELGESADDPSAFSTVLHARDYDDRFATVEDLLERAAGVRVRRYGGLGSYSTTSIRGSKAEQVLVLIDGVRVTSTERGAFDFSTLPLRQVERIEILRGGGGARFGSEALGGVVSITTRRAERGEPSADVALLGGSHATLGGDVALAGGTEGFRALASYTRLRSDNDFEFEHPSAVFDDGSGQHDRLNAQFVENGGLLRGELALGPRSALEGTIWLHEREAGQPGSVLDKPISIPDDRLSCTHPREEGKRGLARIAWRRGLGRDGGLELAGYHRREAGLLDDPGGACGLVNPLVTGGRTRSHLQETSSGLDLLARAPELGLAGVRLGARSSVALRYDGVDTDDAESHRRTSFAFSAQGDVALLDRRLRFVPVLGFDGANTSEGLARSSAAQAFKPVALRDESVWLPGIGAIAELHPGLRVKANWKRAFRRPTFADLFHPDYGYVRGDPALRSERAWNADVGIELAASRLGPFRDLSLQLVGFQREIDESIEWVFNGNNAIMPINTGPARARGIEVGGSFSIGRVELIASRTWTRTRYSGEPCRAVVCNPTDRVFPHVPERTGFARAVVDLGSAQLYTELRYESGHGFAFGRALTTESALQVDAGVSIRAADLPGVGFLPRRLTLSLDAVNLGEEQRVDSLTQPLPGQSLLLVRLRAATR